MASLFELIGGEVALRKIVDDFVEHAFADPMIGFFFAKADKARIKEKEYEFAAGHLGAPVPYTGRPLPHAHAAHPITGGHFMRRLQLLREALERHAAPDAVIAHWLEHSEKMRPFITTQQGSKCDDSSPSTATPSDVSPNTAPATDVPQQLASNPTPETVNSGGNPKPTPSIEEINAYLERSAALTKKRLPLAFSSPEAAPAAGAAEVAKPSAPETPANVAPTTASRALPLVGGPKITR